MDQQQVNKQDIFKCARSMYVSTIRCFLAGCYCNGCNGGGSDENAKATRRRRSSAFGMSAKKRSGRRPSTSAKFVFSAGQSAIKGLLWRNHRALTPTCSSASQVKLIIIFQSSPDGISACIFVIDSQVYSYSIDIICNHEGFPHRRPSPGRRFGRFWSAGKDANVFGRDDHDDRSYSAGMTCRC